MKPNILDSMNEVLSNSEKLRQKSSALLRKNRYTEVDDEETPKPKDKDTKEVPQDDEEDAAGDEGKISVAIDSIEDEAFITEVGKCIGYIYQDVFNNNDLPIEDVIDRPEVYTQIKEKLVNAIQSVDNEDSYRDSINIGLTAPEEEEDKDESVSDGPGLPQSSPGSRGIPDGTKEFEHKKVPLPKLVKTADVAPKIKNTDPNTKWK